jgi:hypothetical protein
MGFIGTAQLRPSTGPVTWDNGKYSIREIFRIITDNVQMEGDQVLYCPGMPRIYDPHPRLPLLRARRFQADRIMPASAIWEAEVTFETPERREGYGAGPRQNESTRGTGVETPGQNTNPLLELPSIKFDFTEREIPITQVVDAITQITKPPTSSNGEIYDPPPKMLKVTMTLDIARNEPLWANHPALGIAYANAQNADVFWGMSAGVWRMKKISPERQVKQLTDGGTAVFLRVVYQLEATDTWDLYLLDYGSYYLTVNVSPGMGTSAAMTTRFTTSDQYPTVGPLDGQGGALARNRQVTASGNFLTIVSPAPGNVLLVNSIVQFSNVGGHVPGGLTAGAAYYVINPNGVPSTFQVSLTQGGQPITLTDTGTGTTYVSQPAVYNIIRPPPGRKPFAPLGLPQSWFEVQ